MQCKKHQHSTHFNCNYYYYYYYYRFWNGKSIGNCIGWSLSVLLCSLLVVCSTHCVHYFKFVANANLCWSTTQIIVTNKYKDFHLNPTELISRLHFALHFVLTKIMRMVGMKEVQVTSLQFDRIRMYQCMNLVFVTDFVKEEWIQRCFRIGCGLLCSARLGFK